MPEGHTERLEAALAGRYRIERKLGEGGMASVYLAEDLKHKRKVALKILRPELAAVIGADRFLAEIRTTANLQHPHILPLFDSGEASGYLYYVMPFIDGETLREKLDREKQLGIQESVRIARDVADALDYAHRQGVIHRDIKPGNILLHDGRPVVADFGIALAVSAAGGGRMTETGLSLGTPHYMSPEQASADRDLSVRSDIYSLGCVLYEMLAGQPPHTGPSAQTILVHILTKEVTPLTELRHTVPSNVAAAVAKAIEKLPADRFETARQFMEALEDERFAHDLPRVAQDGGHAEHTGTTRNTVGRWNGLTVGFASLAGVLAVALGWALSRPGPQSPRTSRQVLSAEGWAAPNDEMGRYVALAPDGSSMVVPFEGGLGLKAVGSVDIVPLSGTEGARDVVYSPDGRSIAYAVDDELYRLQVVGGSPVRLAEGVEANELRVAMAWLDDHTLLHEQPGGAVVHIPEGGGDPFAVFADTLLTDTGGLIWMDALPDGRGALAVRTGTASVPSALLVIDLQAGNTKLLLENVVRAWYTPTGDVVYVRTDGAVFGVPFDLESLEPTGDAVPLFDGVRVTSSRADMRLARNGTLLYVEGISEVFSVTARQLTVVDGSGTMRDLALSPRPIANSGLGWSPDGASIVFSSAGQIYTYDVVRNTLPRQITLGGTNDFPVFSPDGQRVAFASLDSTTAQRDIFVKNLDDASPPRLLVGLEGNQVPTQWPADSLLVFESTGSDARASLWLLDPSAEAPQPRRYLESEGINLQRMVVSPDGTLAAYRSSSSRGLIVQGEIYINSFPKPGSPTLVTTAAYAPMWSLDGRTLYYAVAPGQPIMAAHLQTRPVPVVLSLDTVFVMPAVTNEPDAAGALHPDGDRFLLAVGRDVSTGEPEAEARPERLILVENWLSEVRERMEAP